MNPYRFYLNILLALFLIFAGIMHFIKPRFYNRFIPEFLPKLAVNYFVGLVEFLLGVGLIYAPFQELAGKGTFLLMIFFLPIHVLDFWKEQPAIGS
ncbi:MAG: hypothetical protein EBS35_04290, partial [Bacteroidetes bacterium]|nr:hypothetical protein [Bacteroidota bacterium]